MTDDGDREERELQGEKRRYQGVNEEISSDIRYFEDSDCSHNTSYEDYVDPRPAKRRKPPLVPTGNALTPPVSTAQSVVLKQPHNLAPSSTTQPEMEECSRDSYNN
jgi:hypothetical protein